MAVNDESTSAWLKKGIDPSTSDENFKDGYIDMLADRRKPFNDLTWVLKKVQTPAYKYQHERDYAQLNKDVLNSNRVTNVIEKISKEAKMSFQDVQKEAEEIIKEMAHKFNMRSVRTLGYILIKVLKKLLDHVYVNTAGLAMLNNLVQEYPVLLVPSHRSYFDFLIFSIMCFNYDLPLPAIVAAQDFQSMFIVGSMLRNSGAFYIKRTFRSDELYWAIFTEYVQTQLYNGDHPIEFFVEGTRSRTQKSYAPKLGMLAGSLEAYFKGLVPDIMIVPISISYDRVLEENLFAQELLGIPKPKESTSKLFKVFNILNENYGSIHVTIADPLSTRRIATGRIHRPLHSLEPRFMINITDEEEALVSEIGHAVIWQQQKHMVLSVWCLIATVLLQHRDGITISDLTETVRWLKRHANNVGAYIDWPGGMTDEEVICSCLSSHQSYVNITADFVTIAPVDHGDRLEKASHIHDGTIADAATHMVLVIYRNQLVHAFVPYSLLSMIIVNASRNQSLLPKEAALKLFTFAVNIFAKEFVLDTRTVQKAYENAVQVLVHTGDISVDSTGAIVLSESVTRFTKFLSNMLLPFVSGYWILCQYIVHTTIDIGMGKETVVRPKELSTSTQYFVLNLINNKHIQDYELLNLDMLSNAVAALKQFNAVYYEVRNGERFVAARLPMVNQVVAGLQSLAVLPQIPDALLNEAAINSSFKARL